MRTGTLTHVYVICDKDRSRSMGFLSSVHAVFPTKEQAEGYIQEEILSQFKDSVEIVFQMGFIEEGDKTVCLVEHLGTHWYKPDYCPETVRKAREMALSIWNSLTPDQRKFLGLTQPQTKPV